MIKRQFPSLVLLRVGQHLALKFVDAVPAIDAILLVYVGQHFAIEFMLVFLKKCFAFVISDKFAQIHTWFYVEK